MKKLLIILTVCLLAGVAFFYPFKVKEKRTEVVFWTVQLAPFADYMNNVIDNFEKIYPDIKIKWIDVPYSEAEKRVLASLLSSSMPDLVNITSDFNMTLASKGALEEADIGLEEYNAPVLGALTVDGKVWGVPFYATSAITVYNKDLLKSFDLAAPPETYEELFKQIENSPIVADKYLFMPTLTENDTLYKILNKYEIASPDRLLSAESEKFFLVLRKLYKDSKIPKEAISQTHREVLEKYAAGQIVYLQAGTNFLNIIKENSLEVYNKTGVAKQFYGKEEKFDFSLMTLAVPKKAKHKYEGFLFAKYLTNAQNQLEFAKLTGILPCNKAALEDGYFSKYDENDLNSKARYIAAKQMLNPITYPKQSKHHKDVLVLLNSLVERILLNNTDISTELKNAAKKWEEIIEN